MILSAIDEKDQTKYCVNIKYPGSKFSETKLTILEKSGKEKRSKNIIETKKKQKQKQKQKQNQNKKVPLKVFSAARSG